MKKIYEDFLHSNQLKNTKQRKVLFDFVMNQKNHFTKENLLEYAQEHINNLGIATIYRFLHTLVKSNLLEEHEFGGEKLFEVKNPENHHDHLICEKCGKIIEFTNTKIEHLQEKIALEHHFKLLDHKLILYGTCQKCQKK